MWNSLTAFAKNLDDALGGNLSSITEAVTAKIMEEKAHLEEEERKFGGGFTIQAGDPLWLQIPSRWKDRALEWSLLVQTLPADPNTFLVPVTVERAQWALSIMALAETTPSADGDCPGSPGSPIHSPLSPAVPASLIDLHPDIHTIAPALNASVSSHFIRRAHHAIVPRVARDPAFWQTFVVKLSILGRATSALSAIAACIALNTPELPPVAAPPSPSPAAAADGAVDGAAAASPRPSPFAATPHPLSLAQTITARVTAAAATGAYDELVAVAFAPDSVVVPRLAAHPAMTIPFVAAPTAAITSVDDHAGVADVVIEAFAAAADARVRGREAASAVAEAAGGARAAARALTKLLATYDCGDGADGDGAARARVEAAVATATAAKERLAAAVAALAKVGGGVGAGVGLGGVSAATTGGTGGSSGADVVPPVGVLEASSELRSALAAYTQLVGDVAGVQEAAGCEPQRAAASGAAGGATGGAGEASSRGTGEDVTVAADVADEVYTPAPAVAAAAAAAGVSPASPTTTPAAGTPGPASPPVMVTATVATSSPAAAFVAPATPPAATAAACDDLLSPSPAPTPVPAPATVHTAAIAAAVAAADCASTPTPITATAAAPISRMGATADSDVVVVTPVPFDADTAAPPRAVSPPDAPASAVGSSAQLVSDSNESSACAIPTATTAAGADTPAAPAAGGGGGDADDWDDLADLDDIQLGDADGVGVGVDVTGGDGTAGAAYDPDALPWDDE